MITIRYTVIILDEIDSNKESLKNTLSELNFIVDSIEEEIIDV